MTGEAIDARVGPHLPLIDMLPNCSPNMDTYKCYSNPQSVMLAFSVNGGKCRDVWLFKMFRMNGNLVLNSKQNTYATSTKA